MTDPRDPRAPSDPPDPPPSGVRPGWAPFLVPGRRVVVRSAIDPASSPGGERMTDALGTVLRADARTLTIMTRRGEVTVLRGLVLAAKPVPDPPVRRARPDHAG